MDKFCINRGTLFDNPGQATLVAPGPEIHSVHCLVDVAQCINSGYTVLKENPGDDTYSVSYRLDDNGDSMMKAFAEDSGKKGTCKLCDGKLGGTIEKGFRATVIGRITELGDPSSSQRIAQADSLVVSEIMASSIGCANFDISTCPALEDMGDEEEDSPRLVLSEDPLIVLNYTVLTPDNSDDLTADQIAAGGVMMARLEYEGEGWVAFGISPDGKMVGSEAIIAVPPNDPAKYALEQYAVTGLIKAAEDKQTLIGASVKQENGVTVMEFGKLLKEEGELEYILNADNTFIWAVGGQNELSYHRARAPFTVNLVPGKASSGIELGSTAVAGQGAWKAHGTLATIAWGILAPLAIASSILRTFIPGDGLWFKIHMTLNGLCVAFTVIFFIIAVLATQKSAGSSGHFAGTHQRIGLSVFLLSLFQVLGGIFRPHLPPPAPSNNALETAAVDVEDAGNNHDNKPSDAAASSQEKSTARIAFEYGHRVLGALLIALSFYNIDAGLKLYGARYSDNGGIVTAFWAWVCVYFVIVIAAKVYLKTNQQ